MCRKIDYQYLFIIGIYGSKNLVVVFIKYIGKKMTIKLIKLVNNLSLFDKKIN